MAIPTQKHQLSTAEKVLVIKTYEYFQREKEEGRAASQRETRQRVVDCIALDQASTLTELGTKLSCSFKTVHAGTLLGAYRKDLSCEAKYAHVVDDVDLEEADDAVAATGDVDDAEDALADALVCDEEEFLETITI